MPNNQILATDFGGTTIKLGLVSGGAIIARDRLYACADRPMTEWLPCTSTVKSMGLLQK